MPKEDIVRHGKGENTRMHKTLKLPTQNIFNKLKTKEGLSTLIAEMNTVKGDLILTYDKLNLFADPYLSDNGNGWIRINAPFNQSAEVDIDKARFVYLAKDLAFAQDIYAVVLNGGWRYYTNLLVADITDVLKVRVYA